MMGNADLPPVHLVVYDQITPCCLRSVALRFKGAASLSGPDVYCCRRQFTLLDNRLCTTLVSPKSMSPWLAFHFIALDKCPGIRPIGFGETHRRIIPKAVLLFTRSGLQHEAGLRQLFAGQIASIESGRTWDEITLFS